MNVLLVNPVVPQTYWSLDRVQRMLGKKLSEPPLGLITVAALLPPEWKLTLVEQKVRDITDAEWAACTVLFVTGMGVQSQGVLALIREGRKRGKLVVAGGAYVFHVPEEALDAGADIVVKGESESVRSQLITAIEQKSSGIVIEGEERIDMAQSPIPRYDLLDFSFYTTMEIQFSRGCPFQCEFCDVTLMMGHKVRTKTPGQVFQELQRLYDLGWRGYIFVTDDNFIGSPRKARELLRKMIPWMRERGYPFSFVTQTSVNLAKDSELLRLMVEAGFIKVFLGIESTDDESLEKAGKTQNLVIDLNRACQTINRAGLQIIAGCILGFDNEKPGADQRLLDFAHRNSIPEMFITLLQVGPGTGLWNRLESEGRLQWRGHSEDLGSQTGLINFVPTRPMGEIVDEFIHLYDKLYNPSDYTSRAFHHYSNMKVPPYKKRFSLPTSRELRAVAVTLFHQGILLSSRWTFWRYFLRAMLTLPPERFEQFITACIMGEHYFEYRKTITAKLRQNLATLQVKEKGGELVAQS